MEILAVTSNGFGADFYELLCQCGTTIMQPTYLPIPKTCGCAVKKYQGAVRLQKTIEKLYKIYQSSAFKRDLSFTLTLKEFSILIAQDCFYCGASPSKDLSLNKISDMKYNGIDRRDNNLPYHLDNCVPCCHTCNMMKGTLSAQEFISRAIKIQRKHHEYSMVK